MDTETLIKITALIDARINRLKRLIEIYNPDYAHAQVFELQNLSNYLQASIDADVASMESTTGE
jgi:hypothetical protein